MDRKLDVVESYGNTFRDLINAKVLPTKLTIRKVLKLSKDEDWSFLCSSMDIIGDACIAIDDFLRFSLDGPTKYDEPGERYLRLYGILTATYIQQEAVLKLYQLINVPPSLKDGKAMIGQLEIRILRHKLSSHSTNYRAKRGTIETVETFVPIRMNLRGFNCGYFDNKSIKAYNVDLKEAISKHLDTLVEMLDRILDKAIRAFYKGQETCKDCKEFLERLEELRIVRNGGLVSKLPDGSKLIFTMVKPNK
jgi:exonuclease VII small subunit